MVKEFSVGIMVYNEVDNIDNLLEAVINQMCGNWVMREIIVVSSGSTDGTDEKVLNKSRQDQRIKLLKQDRRYGKCSAVNLFLKESKSEICILVNGDSIPEKTAFQTLLNSLEERIGLIGSRPVPINIGFNFIEFCVRFLWEMHHQVNLLRPKIGEMFLLKKRL